MRLPNYAQAYVQPNKLTGYLLSETHTIGKAKAKFFRGLGFNNSNLSTLEEALLHLAKNELVRETIETIHGTKYILIGPIETPLGKTVRILTVWIIDNGAIAPRFITARPYKHDA